MPPVGPGLVRRLRDVLAGTSGLAASYLFGSRARGTPRADSDVDVAVLPAAGGGFDELDLLAELAAAVHPLRVDLVVLDVAPVAVAHRALRDGVLLTCADERRRVAFTAATVDRYLDMAPLREALAEGTARRVSEGRFGRR